MQTDPDFHQNIEINESVAACLVATQFSQWVELPIRPVEFGGWDNRTFHLGADMSIRLPSAECYVAQVEKEQQWLPKLAPLLPLQIPLPLARGKPGTCYPWPWSIYRWIDGQNASIDKINNMIEFAIELARFLVALQKIDTSGGPPPGEHNFFRGGSLSVYDAETQKSLIALKGLVDTETASRVWEEALSTTWERQAVWLHGDVAAGNLLIKNGRLSAVIDFGCSAVGDPACDFAIAWTFFSGLSRKAFFDSLLLDYSARARARGWALWKALITLDECKDCDRQKSNHAEHVINEVLEDFRQYRE